MQSRRLPAGAGIAIVLLVSGCNGLIGNTPPQQPAADDDSPPAFPFAALPVNVYVAKVKNVLTGTAATDDDIAQVTANPNKLGDLVDAWFGSPEGQINMRGLYGNLFQQSQVQAPDLSLPLGELGLTRVTPQFVQQARDSFPITVQSLVAQNQPFSSAITTRTIWMTPPLLAYYILADDLIISDDTNAPVRRHPTPDKNIRMYFDYHDPTDTAGAWTFSDTLDPASDHYLHVMMETKLTCTYGERTYAAGHDQDIKYATPVMDTSDPTGQRVLTTTINIPSIIFDQTHMNPVTGKPTALGSAPEDRLWFYLMTGRLINIQALQGSQRTSQGGYVPDNLPIPAGTSTAAAATYRTSCANIWSNETTAVPVFDFTPGSADTQFRAVTIIPSNAPDATPFWDINALRNPTKTTVSLQAQRVGFFSTPAFISSFPSNASNDSRGLTNQALIVALGLSINPVDMGGAVVFDTGSDTDHSDPNSACYTCHQALDPMRDVFVKSWTYTGGQQLNPAKTSLASTFDYVGETTQPATLMDFATTLVNHPQYAPAVVQKLCYYANSAPCSEDDPEFLRIAGDFQQNGYDFKALVRDLMTSPLVTESAETKTLDDRGEVVSIARYSHLCASLTNRTGLADFMSDPSYNVCSGVGPAAVGKATLAMIAKEVPLVASNIPSDGFARGAEAPLLPTDSTMFIRSAVESLCGVVGTFTVDLPGSRYSSGDKDVAIADIIANVMGLTSSDPAYGGATTILAGSYDKAITAGATPTEALRSVFTLACTSPTAMSIGL